MKLTTFAVGLTLFVALRTDGVASEDAACLTIINKSNQTVPVSRTGVDSDQGALLKPGASVRFCGDSWERKDDDFLTNVEDLRSIIHYGYEQDRLRVDVNVLLWACRCPGKCGSLEEDNLPTWHTWHENWYAVQDIGANGHGDDSTMWVKNNCQMPYEGTPIKCMSSVSADLTNRKESAYGKNRTPIVINSSNPSKGWGSMVMKGDKYEYTYEIEELPGVCVDIKSGPSWHADIYKECLKC